MALTRITKGVIKPNENYDTHNINSTGIVTATGANITGNLTVGGVLTYEDVTSIDSVGIITAQKGIHVGAGISAVGVITASSFRGDGSQLTGIDATSLKDSGGNVKIQAQASGAMHTGIHTFSSGAEVGSNIKLGNAGVITATSFVGSGAALTGIDATAVKDSGGNVKIQAQASGAVYTGIHTFITLKSTSGTFTGDIDVDGHTNLDNVSIAGVTTTTDNINIDADNKKLQIGASQDLQLFHDGGHSRITNTTGILKLTAPAGQSVRVVPPDDSGNVAVFHIDGSTHLYYDSAHKFSTVSDGIDVVGNILMMDSLTHRGDTNTKIRFPSDDNISFEVGGVERLRIDNVTGNQVVARDATASIMRVENSTAAASQVAMLDLAPAGSLSGVQLKATSEEDYSTGANRTAFFTIDVRKDGTFYERLRINSNGRLGIGENAPDTLLHVKSADNILATFESTDADALIEFKDNSTSDTIIIGAVTGNDLLFRTDAGKLVFSLANNTEKMRLDSSGRLLIGTTTEGNSSADNLTVADSGESGITVRSGTSNGGHIYFSDATSGTAEYQGAVSYQHNGDFMKFNTSGSERFRADSNGITVTGTVDSASDVILKENIKTIDNALDKVTKLRGVEYDYKDNKKHSIGVIAQEVEEVLPELVNGSEQKSVAYGKIAAVLIEAIKEQNEVINKMKKEIEDLKG